MPAIPVVHVVGLTEIDETDPQQPNIVRIVHSFESAKKTLERMNEAAEITAAEEKTVTSLFPDVTASFIHLDVDQVEDPSLAELLYEEIMAPHGLLLARDYTDPVLRVEPILDRSEIAVQNDSVAWTAWGKPRFDSSYQSWPVHRNQLIHALLLSAPDAELEAMSVRYGSDAPHLVFRLLDGSGLTLDFPDEEPLLTRHERSPSPDVIRVLLEHSARAIRQRAVTLLRAIDEPAETPVRRGR